jgi:hypothetical protein
MIDSPYSKIQFNQQFSLLPLGLANAGPWSLFLKDARQILTQLVERPRGFE